MKGCLVVYGFCESGMRLAEEKGRSVKGSCCGADGGAAGKGRWDAAGLVFLSWGRLEKGKGGYVEIVKRKRE